MAVRREKVILDLQDNFSAPMAKAAAAAAALDKSLDGVDGSSVKASKSQERTTKSTKEYSLEAAIAAERASRLRKSLQEQAKAAVDAESGMGGLRREVDRNDKSINQLTGRLRLLADAAAIIGPSFVPIGAVAVPALTGLASQAGFATVALGSLVVASQGVGDALKAVNEVALDPTAGNLEKAREAMRKLGPEARNFVGEFQQIRPVLGDIRDAAAAGWFPGLTESLGSLEDIAPRVASLFEAIGEAGGNLVADGAASLAGPEWREFIAFVENNAPQALDELGRTVGNLVKGLANMWMAFDPLNDDFSQWLLKQSRAFSEWSDGLSENAGFQEFVTYIRESGPKVAAALAAVGDAVVEIVEALAPLGGPSLKIIETFAKAIGAIADSDLGTPIFAGIAALAAYNRVLAITVALQSKLSLSGGAAVAGAGRGGGLMGLAGNLTPWVAGGTIVAGVLMDIAMANNTLTESIESGNKAMAERNLAAFKADVDMDPSKKGFGEAFLSGLPGGSLLSDGAGIKNKIEGLFGKSDVEEAEEGIAGLSDELDSAASKTASLDRQAKRLDRDDSIKKWARSTAVSLHSLASKIEEPTLSLGKLQKRLEEMGRADLNMGANVRTSLRNGADPLALQRIIDELGPQAGLALEQLARGGKKAAAGLNASFAQSQRGAEKLEGAIGAVGRAVSRLPDGEEIVITASTQRALTALERIRAEAQNVAGDYRLNFIVTQTNAFNKQRAEQAAGLRYDGGFTGAGGKYDPAGIVHRGEVVIPADLVRRDKTMLMSRYGHLPNMDELPGMATGGLAGGRGQDSFLLPAGLGGLDLGKGLRGLNRALKESEKALDAETSKRDDLVSSMSSLSSSVAGKFMSDLFGPTNPWGTGSSIADGRGLLQSDTAAAQAFNAQRAMLESKGLDGPALADLLANADAQTIANYAAGSRADLAGFESDYGRRFSVAAGAGGGASQAAFGPGLSQANAELRQIRAELKVLQQVQRQEHKEDRRSRKRGAAQGSRNGRKG